MGRLLPLCCLASIVLSMGCKFQTLTEERQQWLDWRRESRATEQSDAYINEYRDEIEKYRKELQAAVQAAGNIARFNKLLALEYIKIGMFGLALDSLQEALLIEPSNEVLFYLSGVSAMQLAKVYELSDPQRAQLMDRAEYAFNRSAEINPEYSDPLFGISMLYIFERGDAAGALPYLQRLRDIDDNNPHVHALLGRVHAELNDSDLAIQSYQRAAQLYQDPDYRQKSLDNIEVIRSQGIQ